MKVLHILPVLSGSYGGPVCAVIQLCQELKNQGLEVAIAATYVGDYKNLDKIQAAPDSVPTYYFKRQFSLFLPSTIGGDFMRSIDLAAHTKRPGEVIATVVLDRLSGYIGLVFLAIMSLAFGWKLIQDKSVLFSVSIITAILIAVLLILFNKFLFSKINKLLHTPNAGKLRQLLKDLHEEIHYFRQHKKIIVNNLILSILIQTTAPLAFLVIALSLGIKVNIIYFFIFLPIINAITLLPVSIGGLGLRDATTIFFFAKAGVSRDLSFAMSLINFFFILVCGALGGLIYVLTVHHRRIQHHK